MHYGESSSASSWFITLPALERREFSQGGALSSCSDMISKPNELAPRPVFHAFIVDQYTVTIQQCSTFYRVLFKELRMLKLFDIIELKTAMIMYKANKKMLPLNIQRLFSVDEVTYYNTRQLKNMKQVYIRTTLKSKCISICGVKLWNSLKMDLRNSTSLPRFKKEYKKSLLQNYDLSN